VFSPFRLSLVAADPPLRLICPSPEQREEEEEENDPPAAEKKAESERQRDVASNNR
jgi:hypothetical protein